MQRDRIAIIGGGPGGLMTAYLLQKLADRALRISLFEASSRLGGKILTQRFNRIPAQYEAGAAEFYDYTPVDGDPLKDLVEELGLSISPMGGSSVILHDRVIANLDDVEAQLGSAALAALCKFDEEARGTMSPRSFYEADSLSYEAASSTPPRFDSVMRSVSEPAVRQMIECLIHSDLATEPEKTSVSYGLQNYLMNHPSYLQLYSIVGGNEQLPQELNRRTSMDRLMLHRVTRISQGRERRLKVLWSHADVSAGTESCGEGEFDYVVIALPLNALPQVECSGHKLASAMKLHVDQYNHPAHYLRMTLLFDQPFWHGKLTESYWMLDAFHGCCLYDESSRVPEAGYGVLGWLLGGHDAEMLSSLSDGELIERALDSLPTFLSDGRSHFLEGRVHRWIGAVNALPGGVVPQNHDRRHQPEPSEHPGLFMVGDYLFDSTLNGVLDSATYVAQWIVAQLADSDDLNS